MLIHGSYYLSCSVQLFQLSSCFGCVTLQVNDKTHFVVLIKDDGSGLGFSIAGGVDLVHKPITVSTLTNIVMLTSMSSVCRVRLSVCLSAGHLVN